MQPRRDGAGLGRRDRRADLAAAVHVDRTKVASVAFDPEGRRLVTAGLDGMARVWELRRDNRPDGVLVLHAELLSGRLLDRTDAEVLMGADEVAAAWSRLRKNDPSTGRLVEVRPHSRSSPGIAARPGERRKRAGARQQHGI